MNRRIIALSLLSLALTGCSLAGVGDLFKGFMSPGVAVPGNEWKLEDTYVVSAPEVSVRSDAPPGVVVEDGEPECLLQVCTTLEACLASLSAQLQGDQSLPAAPTVPHQGRAAGVVSLVFPVRHSGAGDRVLYNLCREARMGGKFNHLDGHFDVWDRRVVDDANRGAIQ